eukprot:10580686-Karenia_brevis.AAC.1
MYLAAGKRESRLDTGHQGPGIYLCIKEGTNLHFVGTKECVLECRGVRRLAEDQRGDKEFFDGIKGTPWQLGPSIGEAVP